MTDQIKSDLEGLAKLAAKKLVEIAISGGSEEQRAEARKHIAALLKAIHSDTAKNKNKP